MKGVRHQQELKSEGRSSSTGAQECRAFVIDRSSRVNGVRHRQDLKSERRSSSTGAQE